MLIQFKQLSFVDFLKCSWSFVDNLLIQFIENKFKCSIVKEKTNFTDFHGLLRSKVSEINIPTIKSCRPIISSVSIHVLIIK